MCYPSKGAAMNTIINWWKYIRQIRLSRVIRRRPFVALTSNIKFKTVILWLVSKAKVSMSKVNII